MRRHLVSHADADYKTSLDELIFQDVSNTVNSAVDGKFLEKGLKVVSDISLFLLPVLAVNYIFGDQALGQQALFASTPIVVAKVAYDFIIYSLPKERRQEYVKNMRTDLLNFYRKVHETTWGVAALLAFVPGMFYAFRYSADLMEKVTSVDLDQDALAFCGGIAGFLLTCGMAHKGKRLIMKAETSAFLRKFEKS